MRSEKNSRFPNKISSSHKFARNTFFNVAGFVVTFPILILLTPYMLKVLGKANFGIWAIVGVVTSYAHLSDMGMTTAIVKFVAEHWANKEVERISLTVSTAFLSLAVVGGVVVVGILLARDFIVGSVLKVPPEMRAEALFVISGVLIIFYVNLLFSVYNSVLLGLQRMDVTNVIMVVSRVLQALGMWFFLGYGYGLKGLIWNSAIFSALTIGLNVFWVKRLIGGVRVNLSLFSLGEFLRVVKYSSNIFVSTLMGLCQDPLNKIILASFTSLPFVSFYEVGNRVKDMVRQLFQVGLIPLLPSSSELHSANNKQELERMYISISRVLYLVAIPVFFLIIVLAEPIVQVWLGNDYTLAARAIQCLLLGNLFSLVVTPQYIILQGIGMPQLSTLVSAVNGFANVVIALIFVQIMGYYGVLLAVMLSLLSASILMIYLFHRATGYSFLKYIRAWPLKMLSISCLLAGSLFVISRNVNNWSTFGFAAAFSLFYILTLMWLLKEDCKKLFNKLKSAIFVSYF